MNKEFANSLKDKNVLVCGIAKSGISAALLLRDYQADVTVQDLKEKEKADKADIELLEENGVRLYMGKNPDDIIHMYHLIVLSPGIPTDLDFIKKAKEKGIEIIGDVELAYKLSDAPVIGITGTNGKTTTTTLMGKIAEAYNPKTKVVGNIGIPYCDQVPSLGEDALAVAELSSFQLESIEEFKPHVCAVLNITPDHLNRHHSLENYIAAKERIFENQTQEDFTILNYNDEKTRDMAKRTKGKVIFFSLMGKDKSGVFSDEKSIYINCGENVQKLIDIDELNILGDHNVENAMAAIACAHAANIPMDTVIEQLKAFTAVEHRIEYCGEVRGVKYYNDSKGTNPDASIKAVTAMKRPICLIAGGYDKGSDFDEWISYFEGRVKFVAVIGQVKEKIVSSLEKAGFKNYECADTFTQAIDLCHKNAEEGDCVLLSPACASWDMFKSYEERGNIFKDYVKGLK